MISRNGPCWCGSGKRFKSCHGAAAAGSDGPPSADPADAARLAADGLRAHQANDLERAEASYRASLAQDPHNADVLHMLGVVRMSLHDFHEARQFIERAGALTGWKFPQFRHNYGYLLSAYLPGRNSAPGWNDEPVGAALAALRGAARCGAATRGRPARIAVFLTGANQSPQTPPACIANGNIDVLSLAWQAAPGESLSEACRRLIQAGIGTADFVTFWSGDVPPDVDRLVRITTELDASGAAWAFSSIAFGPEALRVLERQWPRVLLDTLLALGNAPFSRNLSAMCLATPALPVMIDNLVVRTDALMSVDCPGRSLASALPMLVLGLCHGDEPVFVVDAPLRPALAQALAAGAAWTDTQAGIESGFRRYVAQALAGASFANPLAPSERRDGMRFLKRALRHGAAAHLDVEKLEDIARRIAAEVQEPLDNLRRDGFDLVGFARTESGLGENLRAIARTCETAGIPVAVSDVDVEVGMRKTDCSVEHLIAARPLFRQRIVLANPDMLDEAIHHDGVAATGDVYKIGYWAWELEKPPVSWVRASRLLNELWLPSEFVRRAFAGAIAIPAYTVPTPIRTPRPSRAYARSEFNLRDDEIVFLFSFAYSSLATRKNPWAVVRAFRAAFPAGIADVRLVVKTVQSDLHQADAQSLRELAADDPRILFIDGFMSRDQMMGLQNACDCLVSLHRSEGFGLGMAECMALGKTVIATAYSANLDFMNERNSLLVDYSLIPLKPGEYPYAEGQVWADADIESAARHMRNAYADAGLRARLGAAAAAFMSERYSEQAIGSLLQSQLRRIAGTWKP